MLRFKIVEKIHANGHPRPFSFLTKMLGFGKSKATHYATDKQKQLSLADLSSLCQVLNCTPNDLLYWQQDPKKPLPAEHPCLLQLSPPAAVSNWASIAHMLSDADRQQVYTLLQQQLQASTQPQP